MAVDEQARHRLYDALEAQLGDDNAAILMDSLPPAGWADVATKQDLALLRAELRGEMQTGFAEVRAQIAELRSEMYHVMRNQLVAYIGANITAASVFLAAVKLL